MIVRARQPGPVPVAASLARRTGLSDDEAIAASLARPDAFEEIFARHWRAISGYLARRVGLDVGEELAAEVFVRAFDRRARFVPQDGNARPWLFGFAAQVLHDHRRRERRYTRALARLPVSPLGDPRAVDGLVPDTGPLIAALRRLPLATRETILLWVWADLSYEQIAQALGVPVGTVRSRIARGRSALARATGRADSPSARPSQEPADA
jgi:RNA polymerase sigma-70 factor (ECF subfamily)